MKRFSGIIAAVLIICTLCSCSGTSAASSAENSENACPLADGEYIVDFNTDSSMFHISEALNGKAVLTVEKGEMSVHAALQSMNILNLYPGKAEDAADAPENELLSPSVDTVTYFDGMSEEVNAFDIPVEEIGTEFDLAIIGTKGKWYDHKVSVTCPAPRICELEDGEYMVNAELSGGTGKASIASPAELRADMGGAVLRVEWKSPNYDYMIVDGIRYEPVEVGEHSVFEIPVLAMGEEFAVIADTTAMSTPHEIEYTIKCTLQ